MSPRSDRSLLCIAFFVIIVLGVCPSLGVASASSFDHGGRGGSPAGIVELPPQGGGTPTDGGDPDEIVILITTPGNPVVTVDAPKPVPAVPVKLLAALAEFRTLLVWAGVAR